MHNIWIQIYFILRRYYFETATKKSMFFIFGYWTSEEYSDIYKWALKHFLFVHTKLHFDKYERWSFECVTKIEINLCNICTFYCNSNFRMNNIPFPVSEFIPPLWGSYFHNGGEVLHYSVSNLWCDFNILKNSGIIHCRVKLKGIRMIKKLPQIE